MFWADCTDCGKTTIGFEMEGWEKVPTLKGGPLWRCPNCVQKKGRTVEEIVATIPPTPQPESVGFDRPEDGSEQRYRNRKAKTPWTMHTFWWWIHNVIAHPLIGFLPFRPLFNFHDWTSRKMHGL